MTVRVVGVDAPPIIDGRLDEAVWEQADVITDFHQTRPGDGTEPSERTEVYLLYDSDALYVGARMYDSEPELEFMESQNKARAMLRAIDQAEEQAASTPTGSLGY